MLKNKSFLFQMVITFAVMFLLVSLTACSPSSPVEQTSQPPAEQTPQATLVPTATLEPTRLPDAVVLVGDSTGPYALAVQEALTALAANSGLTFVQYPTIQSADLQANWKVVVLLEPADDPAALVSSAPQTRFVVITARDIPSSTNLQVLRLRSEDQIFMAGYLAEMAAPDFRAGAVFSGADAQGVPAQAFANGAAYFCGNCTPYYAPVVYFPVIGASSGVSAGEYLTAIQQIHDQNRLEVIYLPADALQSDVLTYVQEKNILVVSPTALPAGFEGSALASVEFDPAAALRTVWDGLLESTEGKVISVPLVIRETTAENLSSGKKTYALETLQKLADGVLSALDVP